MIFFCVVDSRPLPPQKKIKSTPNKIAQGWLFLKTFLKLCYRTEDRIGVITTAQNHDQLSKGYENSEQTKEKGIKGMGI